MFKRYFLAGLVALAPIVLTCYLLYWLLSGLEQLFFQLWVWAGLADVYLPGYGIAAAIGVILLSGVLVQAWGFRQLYNAGEHLVERIPLIKVIYGGLSAVMDMLAPKDQQSGLGRTVLVTLAGDVQVVGFLTQTEPDQLIAGIGPDRVAVYLPLSYQIGGYTLLLKPDQITHLDVPFDVAMRMTLTGYAGN